MVLESAQEFREFAAAVIFWAHLARLPDEALREAFMAAMTDQAAGDEPPFLLDYWRLNLRGRRS